MDCDIYSLPLFSGGNKELIDNILQENPARHRLYAKGDIIALQGYVCKQLYLLCSGSAYARMVSEEGREFTLDTLSAPGIYIGHTERPGSAGLIIYLQHRRHLSRNHHRRLRLQHLAHQPGSHAAYPESRPDRHAELPQSHLRPQYVPEQPPRGVRPPDWSSPSRLSHRAS